MIGTILARRAVRAAFAALDHHDLAAFMSAWSDGGEFVYPGEIAESGTFTGRASVERWFAHFLEQFPRIRFDLHDVCVKNIFAMSGNNVVTVRWTIELTNRIGRVGRNSGVTVITVAGGKVSRAMDFIFDLGENFRLNWAAPD